MIDTHSHIHGKEFEEDFPLVLERAMDAGVERIVLIGVHMDDTNRALAAAATSPDRLYVVAGVHPHEAGLWNAEACHTLKEQIAANRGRIVAVGEMGLDYHYDFAPRDEQKKAFRGQLELAHVTGLPIVIHCREAYDDCLEMLRDFYGNSQSDLSRARGVLHCWFGTLEQAKASIELGFLLGIGGACTFRKAEELHRVVTEIPLEHLVLETDAPYMAPIPFRGKRNEPAYLTHVVARIAELKGEQPDVVNRVTTENAMRLYFNPR